MTLERLESWSGWVVVAARVTGYSYLSDAFLIPDSWCDAGGMSCAIMG
jgi:hypothetical protein